MLLAAVANLLLHTVVATAPDRASDCMLWPRAGWRRHFIVVDMFDDQIGCGSGVVTVEVAKAASGRHHFAFLPHLKPKPDLSTRLSTDLSIALCIISLAILVYCTVRYFLQIHTVAVRHRGTERVENLRESTSFACVVRIIYLNSGGRISCDAKNDRPRIGTNTLLQRRERKPHWFQLVKIAENHLPNRSIEVSCEFIVN